MLPGIFFLVSLFYLVNFSGTRATSATYKSPFYDNPVELSEVTQSLLRNLNYCHLKVFLDPRKFGDPKTDKYLQLVLTSDNNHVNAYSIQSIRRIIVDKAEMQGQKIFKNIRHSVRQKLKCFAHVFLIEHPPGDFLMKAISWKTSPDYVIAFVTSPAENNFINNFYQNLLASHYIAQCLAVVNWSRVLSLCPHCNHVISELKDLSNENRFSHFVNFNLRYLASDIGDGEERSIWGSCDLNPGVYGVNRRPPTVEVCVVDSLSLAFNFSYYPKKYNNAERVGFGRIRRRQTLTIQYHNEMVYQRRQIAPIGLVFDQWAYLVAKKRESMFSNVFTGPFGLNIWLGIFASFVATFCLLVLAIKVHSSLHKEKVVALNIETLSELVAALLASFLDQPDGSPISKLRLPAVSTLVTRGNWLLWVFAMVTLSGLYQGEIFSYLTLTKDQSAPTNLEKLAAANLSIFTFQFAMRLNGKAEVVSHIEDVLHTGHYPAYYPALNRSLEYFPHWLFGIRKFTAKLFLQFNPHLLQNDTLGKRIPKEFAAMDMKKHVQMHRYLMSLYTPSQWLSPVFQADMMMSCMPWTADINYFFPIFTRGLGALYEGGLYSRWDNYHDDINGLVNFYAVSHFLKEFKVNESAVNDIKLSVQKKNWYNYYFYLRRHQRSKNSAVGQGSSVPFHVYNAVYILTGSLMLLALFVFVLERGGCERNHWSTPTLSFDN